MVTFLADTRCELSEALDLTFSAPVLGTSPRCKRFALFIDDGVVKVVNVSEGPNDPSGDADPSASLAPGMIESIKKL